MNRTSAIVLTLILASPVLAAPFVVKSYSAGKSGQINGVIEVCGLASAAGFEVHIPGKSFRAALGTSGEFALYYVPEGNHTLSVEHGGIVYRTIENVGVDARSLTNLGIVPCCPDLDGDGWDLSEDCDDLNAFVYPGADEQPDGVDNDCDGQVDEGFGTYTDADQDGFPAQPGWAMPQDCDDDDPSVHPGAIEVCDGVDNNCDGFVDENYDADGDGYTVCAGDCDDQDPNINPAALEVPGDGIDNDCDGDTDENTDWDLDGWTEEQGDCAPYDESIYPTAPEIPDGKDNDCDGQTDEGV